MRISRHGEAEATSQRVLLIVEADLGAVEETPLATLHQLHHYKDILPRTKSIKKSTKLEETVTSRLFVRFELTTDNSKWHAAHNNHNLNRKDTSKTKSNRATYHQIPESLARPQPEGRNQARAVPPQKATERSKTY